MPNARNRIRAFFTFYNKKHRSFRQTDRRTIKHWRKHYLFGRGNIADNLHNLHYLEHVLERLRVRILIRRPYICHECISFLSMFDICLKHNSCSVVYAMIQLQEQDTTLRRCIGTYYAVMMLTSFTMTLQRALTYGI